jgi:hypothetical protein
LMMTISKQNNLLIILPWHTYWISFLAFSSQDMNRSYSDN